MGELSRISYSYLHVLACPYAAFLRYAAQIRAPTTPWLALGNAVHYGLEVAHKEGTFNLNKSIAVFNEEFKRIIDEEEVFISWPQMKKFEAEGIEMLGRYHEQLQSGQIPKEPLELEAEFSIWHQGIELVGRIDKVDFDPSTGSYTITDFKTGKAKPDEWFLRHNLQLTAYAWACLELYGAMPTNLVWHHLRTGDRFHTERTQTDIDDLKRLIDNAVAMRSLNMRHRIFHEKVCEQCEYSGMPKAGGMRPSNPICDDHELEMETVARLSLG